MPLQAPVPSRSQSATAIVELIPALRAFARTFCRDPSDADDLVQETLTRGIANIEKFEPGSRLKSWLFTIMRNSFNTRIRSYMREAPGRLHCASARPVEEATQEWTVRAREVDAAIQHLPQHQREILMLIGVLGISYEEAAAICGCAVGTVKSRLNRARLNLLQELGEASPRTMMEPAIKLAADPILPESQRRR